MQKNTREIIFPTAVPDPQYKLICIQPIRDRACQYRTHLHTANQRPHLSISYFNPLSTSPAGSLKMTLCWITFDTATRNQGGDLPVGTYFFWIVRAKMCRSCLIYASMLFPWNTPLWDNGKVQYTLHRVRAYIHTRTHCFIDCAIYFTY